MPECYGGFNSPAVLLDLKRVDYEHSLCLSDIICLNLGNVIETVIKRGYTCSAIQYQTSSWPGRWSGHQWSVTGRWMGRAWDGWGRNSDWRRKSGNRWRSGSPKARRAGVAVFATPGTQKRVVHPTAGVNRELVNSTWSLTVHHHTDIAAGWWLVRRSDMLALCTIHNPCLKKIRGWNNWRMLGLTCQVGQFLDRDKESIEITEKEEAR